jgi:hypothetical protein
MKLNLRICSPPEVKSSKNFQVLNDTPLKLLPEPMEFRSIHRED